MKDIILINTERMLVALGLPGISMVIKKTFMDGKLIIFFLKVKVEMNTPKIFALYIVRII